MSDTTRQQTTATQVADRDPDQAAERRPGMMMMLGRLLGMVPLLAPSRSHGCHVVLYYRPGWFNSVGWQPDAAERSFHHALARATFDIADTTVTVLATHLAPFSGDKRLVEAGWITEYPEGAGRSVLLGDLNVPGTGDKDPDWDAVPVGLHSRHRLVNPDGSYGAADRRAMQMLLAATWRDAAAPAPGQGPWKPTVGHWPTGERWLHRSDYVLTSSDISVTRAWVEESETARGASGHLLQCAELVI